MDLLAGMAWSGLASGLGWALCSVPPTPVMCIPHPYIFILYLPYAVKGQ